MVMVVLVEVVDIDGHSNRSVGGACDGDNGNYGGSWGWQ